MSSPWTVALVTLALVAGWFALSDGSALISGSQQATVHATVQATTTAAQDPATAHPVSTASPAVDPVTGLAWVDLTQLPPEASDTLDEIKAGPPYRYPGHDGGVYHNNNAVLPGKPDGYYLEFTVVTPGSDDRGARRIIAGGPERGWANREFYYTGDHYNTFARIRA